MMTWQDFTVALFKSEDADPGYIALMRSGLPDRQIKRAMVAWCSFYNLAIAADASELRGATFYDHLRSVYPSAKRASERRHFRGVAGLTAIDDWQRQFPDPEDMIDRVAHSLPDYHKVTGKVTGRLMGRYFMWKFCDFYSLINRIPVYMDDKAMAKSPPTPQDGAKLIAPDQSVATTYRMIVAHALSKGLTAPPWHDYPFGIQEAETVCCVYKQYRSGKYVPGLRSAKAFTRLSSSKSKAGAAMLDGLMVLNQWGPKRLADIMEEHQ
jgi:hypothetical protein